LTRFVSHCITRISRRSRIGPVSVSTEEAPATPNPGSPATAPGYATTTTAIHNRETPKGHIAGGILCRLHLLALFCCRGSLLLHLRGYRGNTKSPAASHSPSSQGPLPRGPVPSSPGISCLPPVPMHIYFSYAQKYINLTVRAGRHSNHCLSDYLSLTRQISRPCIRGTRGSRGTGGKIHPGEGTPGVRRHHSRAVRGRRPRKRAMTSP